MLNGAYRTKDGKFIEFNEVKEWVLREKEYHGIVSCDKNLPVKQDFGQDHYDARGFRGSSRRRAGSASGAGLPRAGQRRDLRAHLPKVFIDRIKPKTSREEDLTFITKDGIKLLGSASTPGSSTTPSWSTSRAGNRRGVPVRLHAEEAFPGVGPARAVE